MRPARASAAYAAAVIVLGAFAAPWLFWLVQWLAHAFASCAWLARYPFRRVFDRALLIVALAGLWPWLRNLGCHSCREFGYPRRQDGWSQALFGFVLGVVSLLLIYWVGRGGIRPAAIPVGTLAKLVLTAALVAVIEEAFFRGGIQGALQRSLHWLPALLLASAIYAALHFLRPAGVKIPATDVRWWSGLVCLHEIVTKSYAAPGAAVAFVTLFLAGCILGRAFQRTQALYLSMGLHAGWVLANEYVRTVARTTVVEDWLAWPVLLLVWGIVYAVTRRRWCQPRPDSDEVAVGNRTHGGETSRHQ